jgi:chorismate mutase
MSINTIREKIDNIDFKIHELLNERAALALEIGKIKIAETPNQPVFFRPERVKQIEEAISHYNKGPFSNKAIVHIFGCILDESCQLQIETYQKDR